MVIASSQRARIDEALATLPTGTEGHVLDLADSDATQALFARLGGFDHLVFTAGETLQLGSLAASDIDTARRFFTLRYWGAYCAAKYGSGSIRKGGSIVFTSGIAGQRPLEGPGRDWQRRGQVRRGVHDRAAGVEHLDVEGLVGRRPGDEVRRG